MKQLLLASCFGLSLLSFAVTPAYAEAPCEARFVDRAGVTPNAQDVERAAAALERQGAVVRVRVIPSIAGYSNLDQYEANIWRNVCQSWQSGDGGRRSNLIVLYVSMDRKVGFYAGEQWRDELQAAWPSILEESVKPALRDGDVDRGLIQGLEAIDDAITKARQAATAAPAPNTPVIIREQREPTDFSGLWNVLGWIVALAVIVAVLIFGFRGYNTWRQSVADKESARQRARRERGRCTTAVRTIAESLPILSARINQAERDFDTDTITAWRNTFADIDTRHSALAAEFESTRGDPNTAGSAAEFQQMADDDAKLADRFDTVRSSMDALERQLADAKLLPSTVMSELEAAVTTLAAAKARINEVHSQGLKTDACDAEIKSAEAQLADAQAAVTAKQYLRARSCIEKAKFIADQAADCAEILIESRDHLTIFIQKTRGQLPDAEATIASAKLAFTSLKSAYDPSCFKSVAGNGSAAERLLQTSREMLTDAETALKEQEWGRAEDLLASIESSFKEIESLMRSIHERSTHLSKLASELPKDIERAERDLTAALAYVKEHDDDTSDHFFTEIEKAQQALVLAKRHLEADQPKYLDIITMVRDAHTQADTVLNGARDEVAKAKRLRDLARTSLRDATAALSRAKEYLQDHRADINSTSDTLLGNTPLLLTKAEMLHTQGKLQESIDVARRANARADEAYKSARADVKRAEEARAAIERRRAEDRRRREEEEEEAQRRRNSDVFASPTGGWSSPSSRNDSGSGFGGSSSFGDSTPSSGIGGSSDW